MPEESSSTVKIYYPRLSRDELLEKLRKASEKLAKVLPLKAVILFGSYAEGRQTAASDIDVLVIYEGAKRKDVYKVCWDVFSLSQLELHVYTEEEYRSLESAGSMLPKVIREKGIVIWRAGS